MATEYIQDFPFSGVGTGAPLLSYGGEETNVAADGSGAHAIAIPYPFVSLSSATVTAYDPTTPARYAFSAQLASDPAVQYALDGTIHVIVTGAPPGATCTVNWSVQGA